MQEQCVYTIVFSIINRTTGEVLYVFKWSHFRISSTNSKVRTALYSIINSTTGNDTNSFDLNSHTLGFHPQTQKKLEPPLQLNKQYHRKVLFSSFDLNGHTRISSTESIVRNTLYSIINSTTGKFYPFTTPTDRLHQVYESKRANINHLMIKGSMQRLDKKHRDKPIKNKSNKNIHVQLEIHDGL